MSNAVIPSLSSLINFDRYLEAPNVKQRLELSREDLIVVAVEAYKQRHEAILEERRQERERCQDQFYRAYSAYLKALAPVLSAEFNRRDQIRAVMEHKLQAVVPAVMWTPPLIDLVLVDNAEVAERAARLGDVGARYTLAQRRPELRSYELHNMSFGPFDKVLREELLRLLVEAVDGKDSASVIVCNFPPRGAHDRYLDMQFDLGALGGDAMRSAWAVVRAALFNYRKALDAVCQASDALSASALKAERERLSVEIARKLLAQHGVVRDAAGVE